MSLFLIIYIISFFISSLLLLAAGWETRRAQETIMLSHVLLAIFLAVCPIVNVLVAFFGSAYFLFEVTPKIVVMKGKEEE